MALKPPDSPVAVALFHMDSLLDRIAKGRIKELDPSHFTRIIKLSSEELRTVYSHYLLFERQILLALKGDRFCLEAYSNFNTPEKLQLATKYLTELRTHAGNGTKATARRRKTA